MSAKEKTILIVDDELEVSELFSEMLTLIGFQVRSSHHYKHAIDSINTSPPDGIVLDVMMPEISGLEVLNFVRTHPKYQDIPVIICTVLPQEELANSLGAVAFLKKPFNRYEFRSLLDQLVDM